MQQMALAKMPVISLFPGVLHPKKDKLLCLGSLRGPEAGCRRGYQEVPGCGEAADALSPHVQLQMAH